MARIFVIAALFLLAACASAPQGQLAADPCSAGESSQACQVERYKNMP